MKIANASIYSWWRLPQLPTRLPPTACPSELTSEPNLARIASLIAIGGVLLTPCAAAAQGDTAPPASETPAGDAPAGDAPAGDAPAGDAPAGDAPAAAEASAPSDTGTAEGAPDGTEGGVAAAEQAAPAPEADLERDSIVVTGYRKSLKAALAKKKRATGQVDAIVAEDMAEFPDLNLAESLQRMPGVAIERADGEGSRITVRGLGARYSRTRVNGMDARAAVRGNSTRSFDFNMFASELFNSIVVHKTATAELGEGALGAVVDLNTARAFDYDKGFTFLVGAQGGYNDLSNSLFPRATGLVSYHAPGGIWGASASIAYSRTRLDTASAETVRWQKGAFRSVDGVVCADVPDDPGCAEVADAFHPRIPRYNYSRLEGDRIGVTAGVQFRPIDELEIKLDGLYAKYDTTQDYDTLEVLFRGNERLMDISNYRLQRNPSRFGEGNNTLTAATVDNAWVRSEAFRQISENDFKQLTLSVDLDITDRFYVKALGGISRSKSHVPHETTLMYDDRDYDGFSYDYANPKYPSLVYGGPDVTDSTNFMLTELRDEDRSVDVAYDVADIGFNWDVLEELTMSLGGSYKAERMTLGTKSRSGSACRDGLNFDCDTDGDGMNDVLGPPGRPGNSDAFEYPGEVGGGSNTRWTSPNIDRWVDELGFYDLAATDDRTNIREVEERSVAGYLQASGEVPLANMRLAYNAGVRYVRTYQTSAGYLSTAWVEVERDPYNDVLPSASAALWLTDDVVTRVAGARVMSRPELGDLSPGATVDSFNFRVNATNPYLDPTRAWAGDVGVEWYFADESILGVAGFVKKIDSFPETLASTGTYASTGYSTDLLQPTSPAAMDPEGTCGEPEGCWDIQRRINGGGATILGAELGFAAPFSAFSKGLPVVLRDMGVTANYTFIHSRFPWNFQDNTIQERLAGLSTHSTNATLYYDDSRFSLRGSLAWRSQYISAPGSALNVPVVNADQNGNLFSLDEPEPRLDMSSSFKITKSVQVTAEALNLTNAATSTFVDIDARRPQTYAVSGRTFFLGARYSFTPDAPEKEAER